MEFKYEKEYEDFEKWYTVGTATGIIENESIYAVEIMDPAGGVLCDRDVWKSGEVAVAVFGITDKEFELFSSNKEEFDLLVERLKAKIPKDRLFAERNCVRKIDREDTIDENGEFSKYISAKIKKKVPDIGITPREAIKNVLLCDKLCVAYSKVTDRPVLNIMNERAGMVLSVDEALMDEFIKIQPAYKKVFLKDMINSDTEDSVFILFLKLGINMVGYLLPDNKVLNIPIAAFFGSEDYKSRKPENIFCNPMLDRHITAFIQVVKNSTQTEEAKKTTANVLKALDIKIMESLIGGRFVVKRKLEKAEDGSMRVNVPVVENKQTHERLIPVATMEEEISGPDEGYENSIVDYKTLIDMVNKTGMAGFIINCQSKCGMRFDKNRISAVANFEKWIEENKEKENL